MHVLGFFKVLCLTFDSVFFGAKTWLEICANEHVCKGRCYFYNYNLEYVSLPSPVTPRFQAPSTIMLRSSRLFRYHISFHIGSFTSDHGCKQKSSRKHLEEKELKNSYRQVSQKSCCIFG